MRDLWPMLRIDLRLLPFVAVAAVVLVAMWMFLGIINNGKRNGSD